MLNATRVARCTRQLQCSRFSSTQTLHRVLPNATLDLDPSLQALLKDVDISLKNANRSTVQRKALEIVNGVDGLTHGLPLKEWSSLDINANMGEVGDETRKSPAALFGSNKIGSVVIPEELQSAVEAIISESHKALLHSDAKRLFLSTEPENGEAVWDSHYDKAYRTRTQAARHATRDGTAFASVALPAHYSAIMAVIHHVKMRLGPSWIVNRVIDWGSGTGSGLWASLYSFQNKDTEDEPRVATSSIKSYLGVDKREGLVSIGRKLINRISPESLDVRWERNIKEGDKLLGEAADNAIALSAFTLTTLSSPLARKSLIEEMWASGAHTLILIDHDSAEGFNAIANARQHVLELSRLAAENTSDEPVGCHVLAPCAHDRTCPLLNSGGTPLICGFSQRLQRPTFLRRTKHSGVGHEDIHYSYVVIRRAPRPDLVTSSVGRIGGIGKRDLETKKRKFPIKELEIHDESKTTVSDYREPPVANSPTLDMSGLELQTHLRKDAYQWPRLVFPPLKKSGHVILDACTAQGKIMRITIPKSQGKQAYYDARKSSWGDIFPHPPKNMPQERQQKIGNDIGKRKEHFRRRERESVAASDVKRMKKLSKKDYARIRNDKIWLKSSEPESG